MSEEREGKSAQEAKTTDLLIGQVLDGRYRLLSKLGQGGMGSVYLADDKRLNIHIAVKVIPSKNGDTNRIGMQRFRFEAHAAARVRGDHVVRVSDYGISGTDSSPIAYIAMELLHGEDLAAYMTRHMTMHGPLPWSRTKKLILEIAHGLASIHEAGLVHRDMKPSNCFLAKLPGGREQVKIFDFGIAKSMETHSDQLTREGMILGTMAYMAPEQATGKKVDGRTDIYALGAILFQMLSGRPPFVSDHWHELLAQIAYAPPPSLREFVNPSSLPPHIDALLTTSLHKNPERRFPDIASFISSIESMGSGAYLWLNDNESTELISVNPTTTITIPPPAPKTINSPPKVGISTSQPTSRSKVLQSALIFGVVLVILGIWWRNNLAKEGHLGPKEVAIATENQIRTSGLSPKETPFAEQSKVRDQDSPTEAKESIQADRTRPGSNTPSEIQIPSIENQNSQKSSTPIRPTKKINNIDSPKKPKPVRPNNSLKKDPKRTPSSPPSGALPKPPPAIEKPVKNRTYADQTKVEQQLQSTLRSVTSRCRRFYPAAAGKTAQVTIRIDRAGQLEFDSIRSGNSAVNSATDCVGKIMKGSTRFRQGLMSHFKKTMIIEF